VKNSEYQEITGVSNNTAYNDLQELTDRGIVEKKGKGRGTRYEYII
jgi:Fic family protein